MYDQTNLTDLLAAINGLTAAEKMNISNMIFIETFAEKNLQETHPFFSQVRAGSKIPILEESDDFGSFPFTTGNCSLPECTMEDNFSTFTWDIQKIGCKVTICMENFLNDFLVFFNTWKKMNEDDIETALIQFIIERFQAKHKKAEIRVAYFGDTDADSTLINGMNGFFAQMQALATVDNTVTISQNDAVTVPLQTITDGEVVYNYLKAMYDKAAVLPWFMPEKMIYRLDRTHVNALVGWLNTQADLKGISCDCIDPEKVTKARVFTVDNLTVFGIPVEPLPFIQIMKAIGADTYDSVTGLYINKNRMILARKENMMLGYEMEETFKSFKVYFDEKEDEIVIKGSSLFGVGVPTNSFVLAI